MRWSNQPSRDLQRDLIAERLARSTRDLDILHGTVFTAVKNDGADFIPLMEISSGNAGNGRYVKFRSRQLRFTYFAFFWQQRRTELHLE
jgi:hypothetical protein